MTAARQKRKQSGTRAALLAGLAALPFVCGAAARAAVTETIVVDWHTGLAISGFDPVAFFTDSAPVIGSAEYELSYGGAIWRFCNVGNRAAFAERPDVYMPRYGGYDPIGVAHGVAVAGRPNLWVIADDRLFLFYDTDRRDKFAADAERSIAAADRKWPDVLLTLSP